MFPSGCVSQGMCEMQDCGGHLLSDTLQEFILCSWQWPWRSKGVQNPHKPNKSRSKHAAEQGLLGAEWQLFVVLVDQS